MDSEKLFNLETDNGYKASLSYHGESKNFVLILGDPAGVSVGIRLGPKNAIDLISALLKGLHRSVG
jgi:hypothetical protein